MGVKTPRGRERRNRDDRPRREDIAFIAGRLLDELVAARRSSTTQIDRLHQICRASVQTAIDVVTHRPVKEPFDISDGLGELSQTLLHIIRDEYALVLSPEPVAGLIDTLTLATGGLMYRGACGLLGPHLDLDVDELLTTVMRCAV
ncbi:MAG: hypothetical protein JWP74_2509 [Marmoricola sp.]|nr:hypothetical protein [Marmoricola sp.]